VDVSPWRYIGHVSRAQPVIAKADYIKKLIASYGRSQDFRTAALRIIEDALAQGKKPLADSLRKILDATDQPDYQTLTQPNLTRPC
jgi:hypothetical protein